MKPITISLLAISFLLFGCGNTSNKQTEVVSQQAHQHSDEKENIRLNNGERWLVNNEMKPYIHEAEKVLMEYDENESKEYRKLASILKEKNSAIIKSCTMEGESHDEVHKWLHPHIELTELLEKTENPADAGVIVGRIIDSFATYKRDFQ